LVIQRKGEKGEKNGRLQQVLGEPNKSFHGVPRGRTDFIGQRTG
jgi:hypothetical protein